LIELLLVTALLMVVSVIGIWSIASQGDAMREIEGQALSAQAAAEAEWTAIEMPKVGRVWLRKI